MSDPVPHLPPHLEGQSSSWLSKATSASILGHPLVWTGMTALFILIGYLWLQYYARPLSERLGSERPDSEQIGANSSGTWNPEIYREVETRELMNITHQGDDQRADDYREIIDRENRIQPLLRQAREYLDQEAYTGINHENAWQAYKSILSIDPDHKLAQSGLAQIIGLLQANAEYAVQEQQYEEAELWLGELDSIQPGSSFQQQMRHKIAEQIAVEVALFEEEQRIEERNRLRDDALEDGEAALQLDPPELRVAYDLFLRALELDENSEAAKSGMQRIFNARADLARRAIGATDYSEAQRQIFRLQDIQAPEDLIQTLQGELDTARAADRPQSAQPQPEPSPGSDPVSSDASIPSHTEPEAQPTAPDILANVVGDPILSPAPPPGPQTSTTEVSSIDVNRRSASRVSPSTVEVGKSSPDTPSQRLSKGINAYYAGDYNTAFTYLHPLAEANSPRAQFRLGVMYHQGRTVVKNEDLARQWIARALPAVLRAAQKGQAWAQADLGTAYELGIGVKRDLQSAAGWYQKAARQGYVGGQTNLGVLYGSGVGVKYDRQAAVYWLRKAAAQGDKVAQDNLEILNAR